jgi:hypothetical protein
MEFIEVAKAFHEAYERLAPTFNYRTRSETAVAWEELPENSRQLVEAVCKEVVGPYLEQLKEDVGAMAAAEQRLQELQGLVLAFKRATMGVNGEGVAACHEEAGRLGL